MDDLSRLNGKKSRKGLWITLGVVAVLLLGGAGYGGYQYYTIQKDKTDYSALNAKSKKDVQVQIKAGSDSATIAKDLDKAKVLRSERAFMNYVLTNNVSDMKAGYYLFSPSDTVQEMVKSLRQGGSAYPLNNKETITVREGETISNIANEVAAKTHFTRDEFLKAVNDDAFFKRLQAAYPGLLDSEATSDQKDQIRYKLEGYLYPATYNWKDTKNVNELINQMVYQDYTQLKGQFDAIKKSGKTVHQVLTLASLVEREGIDEDSRRTIAGVFENRLDVKMPLQSDSATTYALDTDKTNLSNEDVKSDNPYNLYKFSGYGPGPFNNPSLQSIQAVLNPKDRDKGYLYFVANLKTGKVFYSKDYDEHLGKSGDLESTNESVGNAADSSNAAKKSSNTTTSSATSSK